MRVIRRIDRLVFVPGRNLPLAFFFLVFRRTRTTIDTWRGRRWRGRRERESRSTTGARKREGGKTEEGEGGGGRVAPHILLISVSIVVSVGTPSLRARGATKGGEGPSIILSSVSLTSHFSSSSSSSSSYPLLLAPVVSDLSRSPHRRSLKMFATMTSFPLEREDNIFNDEPTSKFIIPIL